MRRVIASFVVVLMSSAAGLVAQPPAQKPGPEHKKLSYFVGKWTSAGDMQASPMGPGGKMTMTDTCEWFQGGFAVVCHGEGTGPSGPVKNIGLMGYSTDKKIYTYYGLNNSAMAMTTVATGTVEGDTWTYSDEGTAAGQPYKSRFVMKIVSPTSYTYTFELLGPDNKWMSLMNGTSTRAK